VTNQTTLEHWPTVQFKELLREPLRNGIYKAKEFHGRGQKVVNMGELFEYDFISNQEMKCVELNDREKATSLLTDGDLLFARRSLVLAGSGKCSIIVRPSEETTFESSIIRARLNRHKAHPLFFYYFFRSTQGRELMASIATQTAVSGITGSDLSLLHVPALPVRTQEVIAAFLCVYDDLIENNNRRIKILEQMAQMLYREWLVNFRFPGHEKVKMVESEMGLIPAGWLLKKIGEIAKVKGGKRLAKGKQVQDSPTTHPYLRVVDMTASGVDLSTLKYIDDETFRPISRYTITCSDIYISIAGTIGRVGIVPSALSGANLTENAAKITGVKEISIDLLLQYLRSESGQHQLASKVVGTSQPKLALFRIDEVLVLVPPESLQEAVTHFFSAIREQIELFKRKNWVLRTTRDLLLPKLVSGEVSVETPEEEVFAETV